MGLDRPEQHPPAEAHRPRGEEVQLQPRRGGRRRSDRLHARSRARPAREGPDRLREDRVPEHLPEHRDGERAQRPADTGRDGRPRSPVRKGHGAPRGRAHGQQGHPERRAEVQAHRAALLRAGIQPGRHDEGHGLLEEDRLEAHLGLPRKNAKGACVSGEYREASASSHPEQWELFELVTEGTTELTAHVKAHVETGCRSCGKHLDDIRALSKARETKEEFDAFFEELPEDDAPAGEREEFLLRFKKKSRPADRLGRLAHDGRQLANDIVKAAAEEGLERAKELPLMLEADPCRGYAYLYACQLAMPKVASDPAMYVAFARAVSEATRSLPYLNDKGPAQPVCREQVLGEAGLLESSALNVLGKPGEARVAAQKARVSFVEAGEDSFALALADYFEGSAASFESDSKAAWKLLRSAHSEFQLYGQENWQGRAEAAIGTLLQNRGNLTSALGFFDSALRSLHPEKDGAAYASTLINRGYALVRLLRFDAAKSTYAKALMIARRQDMKVSLLIIRYGLASVDLLKGNTVRALAAFERLSADADGIAQRVLSADLRVAECIGRLGRQAEMLERVERLRASSDLASVEHDPALRELFASVDDRSVSYELLAHVARFAEARDRGVRVAYKPLRLVANGR